MERKVGEIFEYNGEWYQCIVQPKETEGQSCSICSMNFGGKCPIPVRECAMEGRSDGKSVIFKKLEKFGEPYVSDGRIMQKYKDVYSPTIFTYKSLRCYNGLDGRICIEIPKNKEDMNKKKLNLKPFDLEAAKQGKPVCTRDGRKARIICFDRKFLFKGVSYPIIALVTAKEEIIYGYNEKGKILIENDMPYKDDLMMLPEKKEGWVNIFYKSGLSEHHADGVFFNKEIAIENGKKSKEYITTIKIEWEE